jgi:predicted transcriptional regulator
MNTKKTSNNQSEEVKYYSAEFVLAELREMLDNQIRKSLIEADAGDFVTEGEVNAAFEKWKTKK